ncbi:uncharacterized [Tachysurus ichikawai]
MGSDKIQHWRHGIRRAYLIVSHARSPPRSCPNSFAYLTGESWRKESRSEFAKRGLDKGKQIRGKEQSRIKQQ